MFCAFDFLGGIPNQYVISYAVYRMPSNILYFIDTSKT